jgi:Flp pilus assembly protein TadD
MIAASAAAQTGSGKTGPEQSAELHATLEQAAEAMHRGDLSSAEQSLRRAIALNSKSLAALNNLGIVLAREGKPADAIPYYQQALKLRPDDPATKRNLALAYFKAQQYRSAWSLLEPLTAKSPHDFQLLDLSGLTLFALDRYPEAARYLERANQADPSDLETLDMLGKAYLRTKDYKALPSVFARIMKLNPNSASAHVMMGTAYDEVSDRPNAIKEYQAAEQADPNFMGVHSGLGYLYWRQGDTDLAEKEMREELKRFPTDPIAHCILGQILLNNSQLDDAQAHFQAALKANPLYFDALLGIGKTEIALKRPEAAISPLRKAIEVSPKQPEAHFVLGTALRQSGHPQEGSREQKISVDLQSQKPENPLQK